MDNILIFAESQKELQGQMKQVLQQLQEHDLFLKPKKCEFNKSTMEYLELIIQEGKLLMDPIKLSGIRDWPTPTVTTSNNVSELSLYSHSVLSETLLSTVVD
jgi:hypothetical protein